MTPDSPAFTGSNLPSEADPEFMAEAGQITIPANTLKVGQRITLRTGPRRLYLVTMTHPVKAHGLSHAKELAMYMTKGGFGTDRGHVVDGVRRADES